ncbi:UPF0158 family protein [Planctomycetota bacterium]
MFSRRGAYGRSKDFLESMGMLQAWYDFDNEHTNQAIIEWCRENDFSLS